MFVLRRPVSDALIVDTRVVVATGQANERRPLPVLGHPRGGARPEACGERDQRPAKMYR